MLIPVILSGGAGTRLWPISRESHPKPFIKLADGQTLLQKTFLRALKLKDVHEILTITNRDYYFKHTNEYEPILLAHHAVHTPFLLEPSSRNTAPAIILAALSIAKKQGDEAIMLVLPADHLIEDQLAFSDACEQAKQLAETNKLVTFGIKPKSPETGFGYIECGASLSHKNDYLVARFTEKPDLSTAKEYIQTGKHFWNSGIFCFKVKTFLEQLDLHAKQLLEDAKCCLAASESHLLVTEINQDAFNKLENISIDYALMEKSQDVAVIQADFDWNDIGTWDTVSQLFKEDNNGNAVVGDAILVDTKNTLIHGHNRMVASIGIDNFIIVDTEDALLIADRSRSQDVKQVVQQLKSLNHESYKLHRTVHRPWGAYTLLETGDNFKIKRIIVKPNASLSLQKHQHRSEHWVVISGTAKVVNADKEFILNANQSTFIPAGELHRLENPGETDLVIIEVQTGSYLGEDDIVRIEDRYGRA